MFGDVRRSSEISEIRIENRKSSVVFSQSYESIGRFLKGNILLATRACEKNNKSRQSLTIDKKAFQSVVVGWSIGPLVD